MYFTNLPCPQCRSHLVDYRSEGDICGRCRVALPYIGERHVGAVAPALEDFCGAESWRTLHTVTQGLMRLPAGPRTEVVFVINQALEDCVPFVITDENGILHVRDSQ